MDILLQYFKGKAVKVIAYADDILLIITGKDPATLRNMTLAALDYVLEWKDQWADFQPRQNMCSALHKEPKGGTVD